MTFSISKSPFISGINPIYLSVKHNIPFGNNMPSDRFETTSIGKYTTENAIQNMIQANPEIKKIISPINLNMEDLNKLEQGHASEVKNLVTSISGNLIPSLKSKVDIKALQEAAYLHDIGKVLIPQSILDKPSMLNDNEQEIMHLHSQLGYELLKTTDINPKTLNLIKYHHQNALGTGYPKAGNDFNFDLNQQILNIADKYSALTEQRVYKAPLNSKQALTIIYNQDVKTGKIHPFIFNALIKSVNKSEATTTMIAES